MTLNVDTIANEAGTGPVALTGQNANKVWAKLDLTTFSEDGSLGVSSYTDNSVGTAVFNLSVTMSDSNYGAMASGGTSSATAAVLTHVFSNGSTSYTAPTTTAFMSSWLYGVSSGNTTDATDAVVSVNGDLA